MEERYVRQLGALTGAECALLREKRVFVAGCGGLGGHLLEGMLRLGVGAVTVCDGDVFEASNLNRQLLSTAENLGAGKAEAAVLRARLVNPEARVRAAAEYLTAENAPRLLAGHDLALDALDGVGARRALAGACAALGIPLVYGAIRGWYAQAAVILPGDDLLERLYPAGADRTQDKSSLYPTPALCAALQTAEAVKLLCGRPSPLAGKLLCADLLRQEFEIVEI